MEGDHRFELRWSKWASLGSPGGSFDDETTRSVGIGYLPDGRMQTFIIDDNGNVFSRHKETTDPRSAWSSWENLGGPSHSGSWGGSYGGSVAVGQLPDGRMQIFTVSYDSESLTEVTIYTIWKETTSPSSAWAKWATLGSLVGLDPIYPTYAGDVAVGYLPDGRIQIFVCTNVNGNGTIYTVYKLTKDPHSAWSGLTSLGGPRVLIYNSYQGMGPFLSVGYVPDQRMQIFVVGDDGNFYTIWKETTDPSSAWSKWTSFGTPANKLFTDFQSSMGVGYVPDQRMQIFVVGSDGNFYTRWKETTDPSSAWSNWTKLGNAGPGYNAIAQSWSGVSVGYAA